MLLFRISKESQKKANHVRNEIAIVPSYDGGSASKVLSIFTLLPHSETTPALFSQNPRAGGCGCGSIPTRREILNVLSMSQLIQEHPYLQMWRLVCGPRSWEVEAGGLVQVLGNPGLPSKF